MISHGRRHHDEDAGAHQIEGWPRSIPSDGARMSALRGRSGHPIEAASATKLIRINMAQGASRYFFADE
jgi:hypothetical protein